MSAGTFTETWNIVNGLPMFARVNLDAAGSGAIPIVHIHGFAISGSYLLPTAAALAVNHPTYVPDLPGYGRSYRPRKTLSIPELADALAAYLDVVGEKKVVLLGNSMGCLIALEFIRKYRDRVVKAVMVSPAGGPHNQPLARGLPQLAADSFREDPRMYIIAVPDYLRFGLIRAVQLFHQMAHYPTLDRFVHLDCPSLIVVGSRDPLVSKERMKSALDLPLDLSLVFLEQAAHAINFSHPELLAGIVQRFLDNEPLLDGISAPDEAVLVGSSTPG